MDKYAIVKLAGKQFKVSEGDEFAVDRLETEPGKKFTVDEVLLIKDGDKVELGTPLVKDAEVEFQVEDEYRDKKIRVAKFKAKSRYRRVKGHRQHKSKVKVLSIS